MSSDSNSGGDGLHARRGLEDSKIESARRFLYESSSDDSSFASNRSGLSDNFPVNVAESMPQRSSGFGFGGRRGMPGGSGSGSTTNLSGGKAGGPGLGRRFLNTVRYHGGSIKDGCGKVVAIGVVLAVLVFGFTQMTRARESGSSGVFGLHGGNANDDARHAKLKGSRIEKIHQLLAEEGISSREDLDTVGSPQALAAEWIANHDGAKLKPSFGDDSGLLQRYALAVLYYGTAGTGDLESPADEGHWTESGNWLSLLGVCAWRGVTCTGDVPRVGGRDDGTAADESKYDHHGDVERLDLSQLGMMGYIPSELSALTGLYKLDLSQNDLRGSIPPELDKLVGLREMLLSRNGIGGTIPEGFGKTLTNLRQLQLDYNELTGTIPFELVARLVELRSLSLAENLLTGTIPDLELLLKTTVLDLGGNQLEGSFPGSVAKLTALVHLDLGRNHLTGTLPKELAQLTALEQLLLREMNLHGTIPGQIFSKVTRLTELGLSNNKLEGTIPTTVGHLKDVRGFFVGQNKLSGSIPRQVGLMADMRILEIQGNKLTGTIPNLVGALNSLEIFSAARNHLIGTIPPEVGQMHRLVSFFVENNKLTGNVPTEMGKLRALQQCRLYDNRMKGTIPGEVCDLIADDDLVFLGADCAEGHDKFSCDCCTRCY